MNFLNNIGNIHILKNIIWSISDRLFRMATSLLVGVWVARYFGPENFGLYNYAQSIPSLLMAFVNLGLTANTLNKLIHEEENKETILGTYFILKFITGNICYLIIALTSYFLYNTETITFHLILILSCSLIFQAFDAFDLYFQSKVLSKKSVISKSFPFFLAAVIKVFLLVNKFSIVWFSLTSLIELSISSIIIMYSYSKYTESSILKWKFSKSFALTSLKSSWPLIISDALIVIYMRIDQIMIQNLTSSKELGLYSAALRLSESWYFLASVVTNSYYPKIISFWKKDNDEFYKQYQKLLNKLAIISTATAIIITICAPFIVNIIYGKEFAKVSPILMIHIWTGIPIFLGVGCSNLIVTLNKQRYTVIRNMGGAITNIALNLVLIPKYGAVGASIATFISQLFAAYLLNALSNGTKPVFMLQTRALKNLLNLKFNTIYNYAK